jgi:hypothetical protein
VLDKRDNSFDFATITDVVLQVRYTARSSGGDPEAVRQSLKPTTPRSILVSTRNTFGDAYYSLFNPSDLAATQQTLALPLSNAVFPFSNLGEPLISDIAFYMVLEQPPGAGTSIQATFGPDGQPAKPMQLVAAPGTTDSGDPIAVLMGNASLTSAVPPQSFVLIIPEASVPPSLGMSNRFQLRPPFRFQ